MSVAFWSRGVAAATLALSLGACGAEAQPRVKPGAAPGPSRPATEAPAPALHEPDAAAAAFSLAGRSFRLDAADGRCAVVEEGGATLATDLAPPCRAAIWTGAPPAGAAVGRAGEAMAFRFDDGGPAVAAIVGDPWPGAEPGCGESLQGVLAGAGPTALTAARRGVGPVCADGLDEAAFWLLAHPERR